MGKTVKSTKFHLRRTLGSLVPTSEIFWYLLAEIEVCIISRTLCALSDDTLKSTYFFPGNFLIGEPLTQVLLLTLLM